MINREAPSHLPSPAVKFHSFRSLSAEFFDGGVYARPAQNTYAPVDYAGVMNSYGLMPDKNIPALTLKIYSTDEAQADSMVSVMDYEWSDKSMYFHAECREGAPLTASPFKDWNFMEVNGKGICVGYLLTIHY